jgi:hypothetical protein
VPRADQIRQSSDLRETPPNLGNQDRNRLPAVRDGLRLLDPKMRSHAEVTQDVIDSGRPKYAPMHAHRELAAQSLAVGSTIRLAAIRAGVSQRQVRKYLENPDFRARIEEHRNLMMSKVRGRLMREVTRRTADGTIQQIELLDLLRVWDRVMGAAGVNKGFNVMGDINVNNTYDTFIQALLAADTSPQSEDFPTFVVDGTAVPSEDPPF